MVVAAGGLVRASDVTDLFVRKTATESVTSSATLQDDDQLTLAVVANTVYTLLGLILYDGGTTGDFKFAFVIPASATLDYAAQIPPTAATTAAGNTVNNSAFTDADTLGLGAVGAGTTLAVPIMGLLVVAGTAGTFKLQWAQNTSNATATRVFGDSFLRLTPVPS